ncbi:inositol monophosphatase family protein [Streptomyces afghaniensis]|uniref:inositol monophosphatase family protein n=1 Tax=Streptomyces afghaniensis TaxID=66865 RepID=UPI0037AC3543
MTYLSFLESLLDEAGKMAMTFPRQVPARIKDADANQVVTQADLAIGEWIRRRIRERFPSDSLIDEESGTVRGTSPVTWIIDPIDGTANFAAGSPLFGVMVGVLEDDRPVAGGVALPALSETYVAEKGHGAYRNGIRLEIKTEGELSQQLIAYGIDIYPAEIAYDCRMLTGIASCCRGIRMSNSVFDCMMVATGAYGAFVHRHNRIWDCVAPHMIIEEAGGIFSTIDGHGPDYSDSLSKSLDVFPVLTAGPGFHETLVNMLRTHSFE